mmetsp:Transcript_22952/g.52611  ORF Transcript_22952/g.52611 Transcript_22952/m.52611 type:complete len:228 (-) Transcript_22952:56-739(-)
MSSPTFGLAAPAAAAAADDAPGPAAAPGFSPSLSTINLIGVPLPWSAALASAIATNMSSCCFTSVLFTAIMTSPFFQPNFSTSGSVKLVTTLCSSLSPRDFFSPTNSVTEITLLWVAICCGAKPAGPAPASESVTRFKMSLTPPDTTPTTSSTTSATMSTASLAASPTARTAPFSLISWVVASKPPSRVSTTVFKPSPMVLRPPPIKPTVSSTMVGRRSATAWLMAV